MIVLKDDKNPTEKSLSTIELRGDNIQTSKMPSDQSF